MICIKKFFRSNKSSFLVLPIFLFFVGCSGAQIIGTGVTTGIATTQDEKSLGTVVNDAAISIGIKDRIFMNEAILITKVGIDVERGKVLLTGKVKDQSQRVEIVRLAWKQEGVNEVINEIDISEGFDIKKYAVDMSIHVQLLAIVLSD